MAIEVKALGLRPYDEVLVAMREFTMARDEHCDDEIWWLEHLPVFTQGQAGKAEHLLNLGDIPLVQSDRGGQVTYHGPGQLVSYLLLDLRRYQLGVRTLVDLIEQTTIELLAGYGLEAYAKADAPGIYVGDCKIASLGLRVKRGCSYHGLGLNVCNDLTPFDRINPCGYLGQKMTSLQALQPAAQWSVAAVADQWLSLVLRRLQAH